MTSHLTRAALLAPVLCWLAFLPAPSQAADTPGASITENRNVADFSAIALGGSMDIKVSQGATTSVQLQASEKTLARIETVVEQGRNGPTLNIRWKRGEQSWSSSWSSGWNSEKVRITVVTPKLLGLAASGSGDIRLEPFNTPSLQVSLSGSGDAQLASLTTDELGISISGSGDVRGDGKATKLSIRIAGSGDVRLTDLRADDVSVRIAGSGDAAVNAQKTLDVSIAGSGDVVYVGEATVKKSVAGSGSVTKR
jgi:hypothetical protein